VDGFITWVMPLLKKFADVVFPDEPVPVVLVPPLLQAVTTSAARAAAVAVAIVPRLFIP
jgi:hypothetical protein